MSNGIVHEGVVEHRHYNDLPHKIKLIRGMKGQYGWEISVSDQEIESMLRKIQDIDRTLDITYGGNQNE